MTADRLVAKLLELQDAVIGMDAINIYVSRQDIYVHLYDKETFPDGEVEWKRIIYEDGDVRYEKSVIVDGVKFFKLYTTDEYKAEVA